MSNVPAANEVFASKARSRVTNGSSTFLACIDGRTVPARRYKDIFRQIINDLGGDPSAAQEAIARRASALCVWLDQREAIMAAGGEIDIVTFSTAANAMRRLLVDLGIERRLKDISPTLESYLAAKYSQEEVQP